ncbi:Cytochrome b6-f complex iron-sulfur subunit [Rubrobacter xylanophilus DSM 9941]|uniref:QcrA and Rieske domain-containing protein n=1 Tax=Rubrobacter xylanophilus TaxID=49319 RepID=UPI001C6448E0|nr:Rieske (2Fe-2S) protein [Rubrobacter xylanophilus]QYJ16295.1 Cytochrome b6-f complex iron-sulfur subunit [Rubrobacter xylanophilus DSM 9941]
MGAGRAGISRVGFLRLGTALGAAAALGACGGGGGGVPSGEDGDAAPQGGGAGGEAIAAASEVPPGEAVRFREDGRPAFLIHLRNGDFVAYSAVCTHQQCTVAYRDGRLACPCHGSVFDPVNGARVVAGPAPRPLQEIPIRLRDGRVYRA